MGLYFGPMSFTPGSARSRGSRGTPQMGGTPGRFHAVSQRSTRSAPNQCSMPAHIEFQHASPGLTAYKCLVQKNGKMSHPGLILPPRFQSTQGLFSPGQNGYVGGRIPVGSCSSLQSISAEVPPSTSSSARTQSRQNTSQSI